MQIKDELAEIYKKYKAKENGKGGGDIPQCGPIDIILKKGKKEISRFQSFPIWYNCPLDGFLGITVKGRYFTIEDSYCDIADRVYTLLHSDTMRRRKSLCCIGTEKAI